MVNKNIIGYRHSYSNKCKWKCVLFSFYCCHYIRCWDVITPSFIIVTLYTSKIQALQEGWALNILKCKKRINKCICMSELINIIFCFCFVSVWYKFFVWKLFTLNFLFTHPRWQKLTENWCEYVDTMFYFSCGNFKQDQSSKKIIGFLHMEYSAETLMIDLEFTSCTR